MEHGIHSTTAKDLARSHALSVSVMKNFSASTRTASHTFSDLDEHGIFTRPINKNAFSKYDGWRLSGKNAFYRHMPDTVMYVLWNRR